MQGRKLPPNDPRHGTNSGYNNYRCRCIPCKCAHALAVREARRIRTAIGLATDDPRHGKASTYVNYGCRCDACKEAKRIESAIAREVAGGMLPWTQE